MKLWCEIMHKLLAILLLLYPLASYAQVLDKSITVIVHKQPARQVFKIISDQTGLYFAYNPQQIDDQQRITLIARDVPLSSVLTKLCASLGAEYHIVAKQIILKPIYIPTQSGKKSVKSYILSGFVYDSLSNQALIGASIFINGKLKALSNEYGFFSLNLAQGKYRLEVRYLGYKSFFALVDLQKNVRLNINLQQNEHLIDVVIVTPETNTELLVHSSLDYSNCPQTVILRNPGLGGSYDALKSLQALPGFNFYGDGSLIFNVRGGVYSQNLILIDDAPVFNPVHLLGFFSALSPYAISNIRVYKNDLPVQFSGRSSAVIDIRVKDGDMHRYKFLADLSPVISSYIAEGPIIKSKMSFLISLRRSHINWLYNNKYSQLSINFWDLHAKFKYKINRNSRIYFSLFYSKDNVRLIQQFIASQIFWKNLAATLRFNANLSNKLFVNTTFFTGRYGYYLLFEPDTANLFNSAIYKTGIRSDFTNYHRKGKMHFGIGLSYFYFNPANINQYAYVPSQNAIEAVAYVGDEIQLWNKLKITGGIVGRLWANLGPTILYRYEDRQLSGIDTIDTRIYNHFVILEPRVGFSFNLAKNQIIKVSYGNYGQFLQLVSNSISPFTTVEAWMPSNPNIPVIRTKQFAIGYTLRKTPVKLTVEAYYKKIDNIVRFTGFSTLLFNPFIEAQLGYAQLKSIGIELQLRKDIGRLNYWVSYTYSRTIERIDQYINYWFWASYDKPHNLYINLTYNSNRMQTGLTYIFTSGNRYTAPVGFYTILDRKVPIYGVPNNSRMPYYSRLDIFVKYKLNRSGRIDHYLTFSVFNLFARKNPVLISFNKAYNQNGYFYVPSNFIYEHQIMPSYYYLLRIVPMLSYTIKLKTK